MKKLTKLSIIIVNWNTSELLQQCLNSLGDWISREEVIVIDNGSMDGSVEMVNKKFPEVKLIKNDQNLGYAKANNQGIKVAKGKYILFLNSDTIVKNNALQLLTNFLDNNEDVGACSPLLENKDGTLQLDPVYLKFPSPCRVFIYYNPLLRKILTSLIYSKADLKNPHQPDQLSGAAFIMRKELVEKLGGFDESFQLYFEDTDLSWRIKKNNFKLMVIPSSRITHLGGQSLKKSLSKITMTKFYLQNYFSLFRFCKKNYNPISYLLIKLSILFNLFLLGCVQLSLGIISNNQFTKARIQFNVAWELLFDQEKKLWQ